MNIKHEKFMLVVGIIAVALLLIGFPTVAKASVNSPPQANAQPDTQTVVYATDPILVQGQVSDFDGDTLAYTWLEGTTVLSSGSVVAIQGGDPVSIPDLYISPGWPVGEYTITLKVDDGIDPPVEDSVSVTVQGTIPSLTCIGFEPPMDTVEKGRPVKVKKNRVLPLKAILKDADGYEVSDMDITPPVLQVWFEYGTADADDVTEQSLAAGLGTDGNQFIFEYEDYKWHYNLKTKNYSAGGKYTIIIDTGNGDEYIIDPTCMAEFVIE
jgi:hypothetical protein